MLPGPQTDGQLHQGVQNPGIAAWISQEARKALLLEKKRERRS